MPVWIHELCWKINDTELSKYEDFHSKVSGKHKSGKEYRHAQHIWAHFNIKTMGEYHDLYLEFGCVVISRCNEQA